MVSLHNLGFSRIGEQRELKFALEGYWQGGLSEEQLQNQARVLRKAHWQRQACCDWLPVGDFSLYDSLLDMSFLLGNIPPSVQELSPLDQYFALARGRSAEAGQKAIGAGQMTKWFDTNYHYIVPQLDKSRDFSLDSSRLLAQIKEQADLGYQGKPVVIGPLTYLWLSKTQNQLCPLDFLAQLVPLYEKLFQELFAANVTWVQVDEPILTLDLGKKWQQGFASAYERLGQSQVKLLLTTYFGELQDNLDWVVNLPVQGVHVEALNLTPEVARLEAALGEDKVLSLGVINGRNIWKTPLQPLLDWLKPIANRRQDKLWLAPSCSLLHVPVTLASEKNLETEVKSWLAFGQEKLDELELLARALNQEDDEVKAALAENIQACEARAHSSKTRNPLVRQCLENLDLTQINRSLPYEERAPLQKAKLNLPLYPTTTIGSFPQTQAIRKHRADFRHGRTDLSTYEARLKKEVAQNIRLQEQIGLDVLVHGEPERNDMVEYFAESLAGYAISEFGWVQSYGSRCVKPPILFGDISRSKTMTVDWIAYAQSLTSLPVKGMLTGPVTLLNWSFVRDDQPKEQTAYQLALAIADEVLDLERSGVSIIQIDEAALREGLPLRKANWDGYLSWATRAFRLCAYKVQAQTQVHTHMCYSQFNDIIEAIASMDADVITIETARSNKDLFKALERFAYPNEIGPGVYDIHSPVIPTVEAIFTLLSEAKLFIAEDKLWINPDCGLKTRHWDEVVPALENMVEAARKLRKQV